ncbi:type I 3-dehydroquinate dehydratase, partial [Bacillus safensis]
MICTPLIGQTKEELFHEVEVLTEKKPDVIEWRADF